MITKREKNKNTMTYWLYLSKHQSGDLSQEEVDIIESNWKQIDMLQSTAADLLDKPSAALRSFGTTWNLTPKEVEVSAPYVAKGYRLPSIGKTPKIEGSLDDHRPRFRLNRGSLDKIERIERIEKIERPDRVDRMLDLLSSTTRGRG